MLSRSRSPTSCGGGCREASATVEGAELRVGGWEVHGVDRVVGIQ